MSPFHNMSIERAILSSIFFNPASLSDISMHIGAEDFYLPFHRKVFRAMLSLETKNMPIDEEFVKEILVSEGAFNEGQMLEVFATNPIANAIEYAMDIQEKAVRRKLFELSGTIAQNIEKFEGSKEVIDSAEKALFALSEHKQGGDFSDGATLVVLAQAYMKEMGAKAVDGIVGLSSSFKELDAITGGFGETDLIVLAARPAMGKTSFALTLALAALERGEGVAFFSLEMPKEQLFLRLVSAKTLLPLRKIITSDLSDSELSRVKAAMGFFEKSSLFIDDSGDISIHGVRSKMRRLKSKHPSVALCVIDYLQLMMSVGTRDRHIEVGEISRGLKLLAREIKVPMLALSQLNRGLEVRSDKRPMLSDLRESGAIEQDADMVLFIYRAKVYRDKEEKEKEERARKDGGHYTPPPSNQTMSGGRAVSPIDPAEIIVGKNRNGPTGIVTLGFYEARAQFVKMSNVTPTGNSRSFDGGVEVEVVEYSEKKLDLPGI